MNKNVLIVLAGGFVIAILVAVLVQAGLSEKKKETVEQKMEILVAAKPLKVGDEISDTNVKWQQWPQSMLFEGAIQRTGDTPVTDALKGRLREPVAAGQPMNKKMVVDSAKGDMLAATLRPGYRAVGVKVPVETIAGGLIGPGDKVDVILTYSMTRTGNSTVARKFASETILENIRVLGIDTESVAEEEGVEEKSKKTKSKQTVTLEVNPVGAEKLALAEDMGDIKLSLRSLGDDAAVMGDKATTDMGLGKVLGQIAGGKDGGVRVYNGDQMQYLTGGVGDDDIGRDESDSPSNPDLDPSVNSDLYDTPDFDLTPADILDAVRGGISDGISQRFDGGDKE